MNSVYKYNPEDFKSILGIHEDLDDYYKLLEKYNNEKTINNRLFAEKQLNDLLFRIKHRELEGNLTHTQAEEIREYVRGLLDD